MEPELIIPSLNISILLAGWRGISLETAQVKRLQADDNSGTYMWAIGEDGWPIKHAAGLTQVKFHTNRAIPIGYLGIYITFPVDIQYRSYPLAFAHRASLEYSVALVMHGAPQNFK